MGAIIGALLVAGSVAANPQMGSSNASPRHEATAQKVLVSKDAHSGYSGDRHGDNGDDPSVVIGNASGIRTIDGTGNTDTNTPVNTCGNPMGGGGVVTGAQCRNRQNHVAVGDAG